MVYPSLVNLAVARSPSDANLASSRIIALVRESLFSTHHMENRHG
jgi:hypothetical protein